MRRFNFLERTISRFAICLPLIRRYNHGSPALDFGCGTGRSTRFLRNLGLSVVGADISQAMLEQARALDPSGEYHLIRDNIAGEFALGSFDIILAAFTFDNMPTEAKADALSALRALLASDGCLLLRCLFTGDLCQ